MFTIVAAIALLSPLSHSLSSPLSHSLSSPLSHYRRSALVALIFILLTLFSRYVLEDPILAPTEHPIAVRDLTPVSVCCLLHAQRAVSIISASRPFRWLVRFWSQEIQ